MSWDSELFVVRGHDLAELCARGRRLIEYLDNAPEFEMKDLAYTLFNLETHADGSTLAIVASNANDLRAKLARSLERLSDPECMQILDVTGIYYKRQGLQDRGKIAFLFPGEGAQYVNMLGDLRANFPTVADLFSLCDVLGGEGKSISQLIFLPDLATETLVQQAEIEHRSLGSAMYSVLIADWALYLLLSKLGLKADVVGGHSIGEMAALGTSGCLETDPAFFSRLNFTIDELERQEFAGKVPEAILLAVGEGKSHVEKIIQELESSITEKVYVAMDNCPHQSVVVGPKASMAMLEALLEKRSIIFEQLPFFRPYHTELFEPLLPHLDKMYDGVAFSTGKQIVYSCSTARPFPEDPASIRRLAVSHWACPVKFTEMIENMYADGVRIFVEVGPRGNLTAFTTDILRGRSFVAIASNVKQRSGLTQLNHLAGQLIAHGVPLNLEEFYCRRLPKLILWQEPARNASLPTKRANVMTEYFQVMEQFLVLQQEVMNQLIEAKREKRVDFPLLGNVVRREPKSVIFRRVMDLNEDLFANHHTVGGRTLSKVNPEHYGLPVIPGTFSLEMAAESASFLVPGKVVIRFKDVRLLKWLAYDEGNPTSVEISAKLIEPLLVAVEIHDLGPSKSPFDSPKIALRAFVELADTYPEPPAVQEFVLNNERPCKVTLEVMRQNLFHGKLFQGVISTDRIGDEGIESRVCVLPRDELIRSHPNPKFILDPVLADVSMHPFVTWHLEQPDQSGRILLPAEVGSFELFAPIPPVGTEIVSRGRVIDSSSRHFTHEVEALGPDGKLLFHLRGAKFWRFYVPFGEVNFHGPKDEYFLSKECLLPHLVTGASCMRLNIPTDLRQPGMRLVTARVTLSPAEEKQFRNMLESKSRLSESKLDEWLFGRICAKDAMRTVWKDYCGEKLFLADMEIEPDQHGRPVGRLRVVHANKDLPAVTIAHTDGIVVALSSFDAHVGIDIEKIKPREASFEEIAFDDDERLLLDAFTQDRNEGITRFWCAKEAVAKALGRGLIEGPRSLIVRGVDVSRSTVHIALGRALLNEFPSFADELLIAHTVRDADLVLATTFCERCAK